MAGSRFTDDSHDVLEGRPNIEFVEPETEGFAPINPIDADVPQLEDVQQKRQELRQFAQAINVLAAATQARADEKAKDMKITLDLNIDVAAVGAMRRYFPDANEGEITYDQYREVKECLRNLGRQVGNQALVSPDDVTAARNKSDPSKLGGFGTPAAANGGLRPELNLNAYIIPPLNVEQFTIDLVCIFINFVWKNFIKKVFEAVQLPPAGPSVASFLPDTLCDAGFNMKIPGLYVLGENPSDLLIGKLTPKIPISFDEASSQQKQQEATQNQQKKS
jgi:hypothetical protein